MVIRAKAATPPRPRGPIGQGSCRSQLGCTGLWAGPQTPPVALESGNPAASEGAIGGLEVAAAEAVRSPCAPAACPAGFAPQPSHPGPAVPPAPSLTLRPPARGAAPAAQAQTTHAAAAPKTAAPQQAPLCPFSPYLAGPRPRPGVTVPSPPLTWALASLPGRASPTAAGTPVRPGRRQGTKPAGAGARPRQRCCFLPARRGPALPACGAVAGQWGARGRRVA